MAPCPGFRGAKMAGEHAAQGTATWARGGGFPHGGRATGLGWTMKMINENGGKMPNAIGVPEEQLRKAASLSVCKINIDSDLRLALTGTVRKYFNEHPDHFDPRQYLKPARANIKEIVRHKLVNVLGCAGKA